MSTAPLAYDFALLMPDVFAHNARIHGDRIAVVCDDERITWREADERGGLFGDDRGEDGRTNLNRSFAGTY